ncbi:hypothetical protein APED_18925 [Acanthopleuribacter pedis]
MCKAKGLAESECSLIRSEADLLGYRHQILGQVVATNPKLEKVLAVSSQREHEVSGKK